MKKISTIIAVLLFTVSLQAAEPVKLDKSHVRSLVVGNIVKVSYAETIDWPQYSDVLILCLNQAVEKSMADRKIDIVYIEFSAITHNGKYRFLVETDILYVLMMYTGDMDAAVFLKNYTKWIETKE